MTSGRNDPCPCGSGKKFKRCCGNAPFPLVDSGAAGVEGSRVNVPVQIPTIVNNDGHLIVHTTSIYDVFDPYSVKVEVESWRPKPDVDVKRDTARRLVGFEVHFHRKPEGRRTPREPVLVASLEWIEGGPLVVLTNSTERDLEIRAKLMQLPPSDLRLATTVGRSVSDMLAGPESEEEGRQAERESDDFARSPEVQAKLAEMMTAYSRDWCDTVVPALGNRRPRTLVRTEQGRAKVLALIAEMESMPRPDGSGGMDFELIRRELGLL
ncbi:MAG: SEC-C metal-binding domain-containing protein [Acidobacteriota bacterium]|nr:SEC-C metal-binding domain-containing protein [Acidobacteriota bacterium]